MAGGAVFGCRECADVVAVIGDEAAHELAVGGRRTRRWRGRPRACPVGWSAEMRGLCRLRSGAGEQGGVIARAALGHCRV